MWSEDIPFGQLSIDLALARLYKFKLLKTFHFHFICHFYVGYLDIWNILHRLTCGGKATVFHLRPQDIQVIQCLSANTPFWQLSIHPHMDGAYNCLLYLSKVRLVNVTFEIGVVRTDDRRTVSGIDRFPISMAMGLRARGASLWTISWDIQWRHWF